MNKSLRMKMIVIFTFIMIVLQGISAISLTYLFIPDILDEYEYSLQEEMFDKVVIEEDKIIIDRDVFEGITVDNNDPENIYKIIKTPIFQRLNKNLFAINMIKSEFAGVLIGVIIIIIATRFIMKPLKEIANATTEVSKGNFEIQLKEGKKDEIGLLIKNFNKMTKELQNIEYLRNDFVSSVSHEFKTPITSIQGFIFLLRDRDLEDEEYFEYIDIITKETKRLSHLSSNLLMLSQLDNIVHKFEKVNYRLDEQIRNAILLLESKWQEKEIVFDIEMDDIEIYCNEELLMQVWINLLDNAIKFSYTGNEIDVKVNRNNENIIVQITDYGDGIPEESLDKIFNRFYKDDNSRSTDGNGLGLSIVKKIISLVGGKIECKSLEDEYTDFIVTLPIENL